MCLLFSFATSFLRIHKSCMSPWDRPTCMISSGLQITNEAKQLGKSCFGRAFQLSRGDCLASENFRTAICHDFLVS